MKYARSAIISSVTTNGAVFVVGGLRTAVVFVTVFAAAVFVPLAFAFGADAFAVVPFSVLAFASVLRALDALR